jgi:hypothetical protein
MWQHAPHWFWITFLYSLTQCVTCPFSYYQPAPISGGRTGRNSVPTWYMGFHSSWYYRIRLQFTGAFMNCSALSLRHSSVYSQMSSVFWSAASSIASYSGWNSLEEWVMMHCWITMNPALKAEVNLLQGSMTRHLNEWRMTSGVTCWKQSRDESLEID